MKRYKKANKYNKLYYALLGVSLLVATTLITVHISNRHNTNQNTAAIKKETKTSKQTASSDTAKSSKADTQPSTAATTYTVAAPSPDNTPFQINKVYFSEAPRTPAGAEFRQCNLGQDYGYTAVADVTASAAGTATYHWELADHMSGTTKNFDDETVTFHEAGIVRIEKAFTYTAHDVGNGDNLWNRQYLNVFFTAPNSNYANKDNAVYSSGSNMVWGTYVDLC